MFKITEKKRGVPIIDVWYAKEKIEDKGIIRYREAYAPLTEEFTRFRTLLTDLTEEEDAILARFTKNCRYEIRRAPRENVETRQYLGAEVTEGLCGRFVSFFGEFWRSKGVTDIDVPKIRHEILKYAAAGCFAVTEARIGETVVVYHTYIVGQDTARLYQSASHFRTEEALPQSVVGMANRYLHKEDMLWLKGLGRKTYDWGGAGEEQEVASITRFKEAFGGTEAYFYDGQEAAGLKAKCYTGLASAAGRIKG